MNGVNNSPTADIPRMLLDRPELAKALGLSQRTISTLMKRETDPLPCVRFGRAVRFDPRDVQPWIDRQKAAGGVKL